MLADFQNAMLYRRRHRLMHAVDVRTFHKIRRPAVTAEQVLQFFVRDPSQQGRVVDLVAVQVKDRQYRAIARRIQELVDVPRSCQRPSFRLSVADNRGHDQFGIVERRTASMRKHVAQFTAFMDRSRHLRRAVTGNPAREGKLSEELVQSVDIQTLFWIDFRIRTLKISRTKHARRAVSRPGEKDHIEVELLDQPVQMNVDKRQARTRSPVPQQAILDVLWLERLGQQWILLQVDHAQAKVIASSPVSFCFTQLLGAERRSRNSGTSW